MRKFISRKCSHSVISIFLVLCVFHTVAANCVKIDIIATDWNLESSELELSFNSDPNKQYQLQTSSDLATFNPTLLFSSSLGIYLSAPFPEKDFIEKKERIRSWD